MFGFSGVVANEDGGAVDGCEWPLTAKAKTVMSGIVITCNTLRAVMLKSEAGFVPTMGGAKLTFKKTACCNRVRA
jgi:hypothetical protein